MKKHPAINPQIEAVVARHRRRAALKLAIYVLIGVGTTALLQWYGIGADKTLAVFFIVGLVVYLAGLKYNGVPLRRLYGRGATDDGLLLIDPQTGLPRDTLRSHPSNEPELQNRPVLVEDREPIHDPRLPR